MNKCGENIATKLTAATVIAEDCNGNAIRAGNAVASCVDLQTVNNTANEALTKANQAIAQNQMDIINITTGTDGAVTATRRNGDVINLQIDTDQMQVIEDVSNNRVIFRNEDNTEFYLTKAVIEQLIASNYIDNTELANAIGNINTDQVQSITVSGQNVVVTNEDGSTATLAISALVPALNNGLATDAELATAIAGINTAVHTDNSLTGNGTSGLPLAVVFATQAEIDAGEVPNRYKAVSAEEYRKEILVNPNITQVGHSAGLNNTAAGYTNIGVLSGNNNTGNTQTAVGQLAGSGNKGLGQVALGYKAGSNNTAIDQTAIGSKSGNFNEGLVQVAVGGAAGFQNIGNYQTALGFESGMRNTGPQAVSIGGDAMQDNNVIGATAIGYATETFVPSSVNVTSTSGLVITAPSHGMTVGTTQAIRISASVGTTTGGNVIVDVTDANTLTMKHSIYATGFTEIQKDLNYGYKDINLIGRQTIARNESNHTVIGNNQHQNVYSTATFHFAGYNIISDRRIKAVGELVKTLKNGIEVCKFTYLSNGKEAIGWVAQQVKEVLVKAGYDNDTINLALPTSRDVDWHATIAKFNGEQGTNIKLWTEALPIIEEKALNEQDYFIYADIMSIDKQLITELLS